MNNETQKKVTQLELEIEQVRKTTETPEQALELVIRLYGAEFIKANDKIAELKSANDELFKIKQKVVIVNRELLGKNHELEQDKLRMDLLEKLVYTNRENEHELHVDFSMPTLRAACDARLRNA